ncbi:MAG: hypothetical protein ACREL5_12595 [Gemmatimonadales bacterium]
MTDEGEANNAAMQDSAGGRRRSWAWIAVAVLVVLFFVSTPGRSVAGQFIASLRIAKPQPVTVTVPGFSGPGTNHQLEDAIGGMVADTVHTDLDEGDQPVPTPDSAAHLAGMPVHLLNGRADAPKVFVLGARRVSMVVDRNQLRTILDEAGDRATVVPASVNGASFTMTTSRAIRLQYGHCPEAAPNTIAGQVQGPPPPPADISDCAVLIESRPVEGDPPPGVDLTRLTNLALQLGRMNPTEAQEFQRAFDWRTILSVSLTRFIRTHEAVSVGAAPAMLFTSGGRRGPSYELVWVRDGVAYTFTGYGSPTNAVALANTTN